MEIGSALLFLALLLLVALFVARPLFDAGHDEREDGRCLGLIYERERTLQALVELDADWELGKIPEEIYLPQRAQLVAESATALKELEAANLPPSPTEGESKELSDAKLDALIASRKARTKKGRK